MNNRVKSLEIRNEVINLIESNFDGLRFSYSYNDLYKVKDGVVRRLKGDLYKNKDISKFWFDKNEIKEFNDLVLKIDNYLKNLNYEGFKIRLKKRDLNGDYLSRERYEERSGEIISLNDYKNKLKYEEMKLILSIRFKDI
jgi:hypothetical protein